MTDATLPPRNGKPEWLPTQLENAITNRQWAVFLGSATSTLAGVPGVGELRREFARLAGRTEDAFDHVEFADAAQRAELETDRRMLCDCLRRNIVAGEERANLDLHEALTTFSPPLQTVVTTNYDRLVEKAFGDSQTIGIWDDSQLSRMSLGATNVYKLHGDVSQIEEAVVTTRDYAEAPKQRQQMLEKFRSLLQEYTFLFIGFSMKDSHLVAKVLEAHASDSAPRRHFAVTRPDDTDAKLWYESLGFRVIPMDARQFILDLTAYVQGTIEEPGPGMRAASVMPELPEAPLSHRPKNPFTVLYAEQMTPELWREGFFLPPTLNNAFEAAARPANVVFEGHRGSGKTMLLQFLSFRVHQLRGTTPNHVGLYVKLNPSVVAAAPRRERDDPSWHRFFRSYLTLVLAEGMCQDIAMIPGASLDETGLVKAFQGAFPRILGKAATMEEVSQILYEVRCDVATGAQGYEAPADALVQLAARLAQAVSEWRGKPFFLLVDEIDNLDVDQQSVFNTFLLDRASVKGVQLWFKAAAASMRYSADLPRGGRKETLEPTDDYLHVALDRVNNQDEARRKHYESFLESVANRRLEAWKYAITVRELFPSGPDYAQAYPGFENLVTLSHYLPRQFLLLAAEMVASSHPEIEAADSPILQPIAWRFQLYEVQRQANARWESLQLISDRVTAGSKHSTRKNAMLVVRTIADVCHTVARLSKDHEDPMEPTGIQLQDYETLSPSVIEALNACVERRVLRLPLTGRVSKTLGRDGPAGTAVEPRQFELHRLLCALWKLPLSRRYPQVVRANQLNALLDHRKRDQAVREICSGYSQLKLTENRALDQALPLEAPE